MENETQKKYIVACYGSLKKGCYNHDCLGEDAKYLGNHFINAVMYSYGSYPHLYHTNGETGHFGEDIAIDYPVEVYEISEDNYMSIRSMELGARYNEEVLPTPYGNAFIYINPHTIFNPQYEKYITSYP